MIVAAEAQTRAAEMQTRAVLQLGKAMNSMASSFRAAKSTQFVYSIDYYPQ